MCKLLSALFFSVTLLASSLALPQLAHGRPTPLRIFGVPGTGSLTEAELVSVSRAARELLLQAGVSVRLVKIQRLPIDPCATIPKNLDNSVNNFYCYRNHYWNRNQGRNGKTTITHYVQPPMFQNGQSYQGGFAVGTCTNSAYTNFSSGNGTARRFPTGEPRLNTTAGIIAHEIAHNLGAEHDSSNCNVMHPSAGTCFIAGTGFQFNPLARQQINRCAARKAALRTRGIKALPRCSSTRLVS